MRPARKPRGPHPQQRLCAVTVRNMKRAGHYADGKGLYLIVDPSGAKRWLWRGVIQGKRCDLGLGSVRWSRSGTRAMQAIALRRRHGRATIHASSVSGQVVPTFKAAALPRPRRARAALQEREASRAVDLDARDVRLSGDRRSQVQHDRVRRVLAVLSPIWMAKPETARRVKQRLKLVFDWARASRLLQRGQPHRGRHEGAAEAQGRQAASSGVALSGRAGLSDGAAARRPISCRRCVSDSSS